MFVEQTKAKTRQKCAFSRNANGVNKAHQSDQFLSPPLSIAQNHFHLLVFDKTLLVGTSKIQDSRFKIQVHKKEEENAPIDISDNSM